MGNALAVDYSKLSNISYDDKAMIQEIAANIEMPCSAEPVSSMARCKYVSRQKLMAVAVFIVIGVVRATGRIVGVPVATIQGWSHTDWWIDCINQTRSLNTHLINARTTKVINKAFDSVEQRLDKGDYATYDSDSKEIIYKPVSAKDSAVIFGVMFDKQRINNSLATTITQSTTTHLVDIQQQFNDMTQSKLIEHDN